MDEEFVKVLIRMPKELKDKITLKANEERRTLTNFIIVLLEQYVKSEEQK